MPNPSRLDLVHKAISSGVGNIVWKPKALALMLANKRLSGIGMFTESGIRHLLRQFVLDGNQLDIREEKREWLLNEDPDNPW